MLLLAKMTDNIVLHFDNPIRMDGRNGPLPGYKITRGNPACYRFVSLLEEIPRQYTRVVFKKIHIAQIHAVDFIHTDTFQDSRFGTYLFRGIIGYYTVRIENGWLTVEIEYRAEPQADCVEMPPFSICCMEVVLKP